MTIIECTVYHWTREGMSTRDGQGDYIKIRDAEKLLEAAHRRGMEDARANSEVTYVSTDQRGTGQT